MSAPALAQSFTYDVTWQPVERVGGITVPGGMEYAGGSVKGTYSTTFDDGNVVKGTVSCVGLDQPAGSLFDVHLSCTATDPQGTYSLAHGCNWMGEPGPQTPLGCVGAMEGKAGEAKGQRGALTMHWYSSEKSKGTGQWYTSE
ncbi:MAG: hypothetical protein V2I27_05555 [Erythrobacter sp.]|jgi:hypothetical protein|nr:hypothetical protein [Erythrobacter sp.]